MKKQQTRNKKGILKKILEIAFAATMIFCALIMIFGVLNRFEIINEKKCLAYSLIITAVIMGILVTLLHIEQKKYRITKARSWLVRNSSKLILTYFISLVFLGSINPTLSFSKNELKEMLSVEWTIFAISITIFLVWNVIMVQYIKKKEPCTKESMSLLDTVLFIEEKSKYTQNVSRLFNSVIVLGMNLLFLIFSTILVYTLAGKPSFFIQTCAIFSLFLSTNAISLLFCDILKPLLEEQSKILEHAEITPEDVTLANEITSKIMDILEDIEEVKQLENIDENQKNKIMNDMLMQIISETKSE